VTDIAVDVVHTLRSVVGPGRVGLHEPVISDADCDIVDQCLQSGYVSTVGEWVTKFEDALRDYTGARYAIAMASGTSALHVALVAVGVKPGDEVLVPSLSFVATANAVSHAGGTAHFVDISPHTLGIDPVALDQYLEEIAEKSADGMHNKHTGRRLAAIVPMHCFGHPVHMDELMEVSDKWGIPVVEDAAEALGSFIGQRHVATDGLAGVFSFNGNKIVTTGGGGAVVTNSESVATFARHLSTTAKIAHPWEFDHDMVGYNYRMPNLNAALGWSQLQSLGGALTAKRSLAHTYQQAFLGVDDVDVFCERDGTTSNYWLNALVLSHQVAHRRDDILSAALDEGILLRPAWKLLHNLQPYRDHPHAPLPHSLDIQPRLVNLPSSSFLGVQ
jgi:perosamine synthetase